ncbi:DUF397 domain-containing protein, partial [Saccharopolyspora sp. NPDC000995]
MRGTLESLVGSGAPHLEKFARTGVDEADLGGVGVLAWRKSSYSANNGDCVETAFATRSGAGWGKSSYSTNNGARVEIAVADTVVGARDSKNPGGRSFGPVGLDGAASSPPSRPGGSASYDCLKRLFWMWWRPWWLILGLSEGVLGRPGMMILRQSCGVWPQDGDRGVGAAA